jgi:hypothetical protein
MIQLARRKSATLLARQQAPADAPAEATYVTSSDGKWWPGWRALQPAGFATRSFVPSVLHYLFVSCQEAGKATGVAHLPFELAARWSGLASGLALAVRPAGLAEVSRVNGAPQARPAQRDAKHR